jgi:hypothetical protein
MKLKLCLGVALMTSCAVVPPVIYVEDASFSEPRVEEDLVADVEDFLLRCGDGGNWQRLKEVRWGVTREKEDPDVVGFCLMDGSRRLVTINPFLRPLADLRKAVVWHELGHCLLDMGHVEEGEHIMNPEVPMVDAATWETLTEAMCPQEEP